MLKNQIRLLALFVIVSTLFGLNPASSVVAQRIETGDELGRAPLIKPKIDQQIPLAQAYLQQLHNSGNTWKKLSNDLNVCEKTLRKFRNNDPTLSEDSRNTIITNLLRNKTFQQTIYVPTQYDKANFYTLLNILKDGDNNFANITSSAGYSGLNGTRDFKSMIDGRCQNPRARFNRLINAIREGRLQIQN